MKGARILHLDCLSTFRSKVLKEAFASFIFITSNRTHTTVVKNSGKTTEVVKITYAAMVAYYLSSVVSSDLSYKSFMIAKKVKSK